MRQILDTQAGTHKPCRGLGSLVIMKLGTEKSGRTLATKGPSIGALFSKSGIEASLILGESSEADLTWSKPGLAQFEIRLHSLGCSGVASGSSGRMARLTCPSNGNIRFRLNGAYDRGVAAVGRWERETSD